MPAKIKLGQKLGQFKFQSIGSPHPLKLEMNKLGGKHSGKVERFRLTQLRKF
jgi:hypothetical protein